MSLMKATYERPPRKLKYQMEHLAQISSKVSVWMGFIPLDKWALSHNEGRRYA